VQCQIRGVLLDLGDTLVHLDKPWEEVFEAEVRSLFTYLDDAGVRTDFSKFSIAFVRAFEETTAKASLYRIEIPMEEIITNVVGKFGVRNPYEGFIQSAIEAYYRPEIESWQLFPDTIDTLASLEKNGYVLGLISNARSTWQVDSILRKFDLARFFKVVLISASLRIRKPRGDIFLKALDDLNLTPQETVFIGNSIDADVIGPRSVGIHTIHLRRQPPEHALIVGPEATVSSLNQAVKTVNNWAKIN
jgi:HAD superfamily hydrolase (TIGR01549 family)